MSEVCKKMLKDWKFQKTFSSQKNKAWYEEKECINNIVTERYKRSSIPVMKKMLNEEDLRLKRAMQNINIVPREHCFINSNSEKI